MTTIRMLILPLCVGVECVWGVGECVWGVCGVWVGGSMEQSVLENSVLYA